VLLNLISFYCYVYLSLFDKLQKGNDCVVPMPHCIQSSLRYQLTMANHVEQMEALHIFEVVWIRNLQSDRQIQMDQRLFDCLRIHLREPFLIQAKKTQLLIKLLFTKSKYRDLAFNEVVLALLSPSPRLQLYTNKYLLHFIPIQRRHPLQQSECQTLSKIQLNYLEHPILQATSL